MTVESSTPETAAAMRAVLIGDESSGYCDQESVFGQLFLVWDALNKIREETAAATDTTSEHVHDVAEGAMELVDTVRARIAALASGAAPGATAEPAQP